MFGARSELELMDNRFQRHTRSSDTNRAIFPLRQRDSLYSFQGHNNMIIQQPKLTAVMIIGPITFLIIAAIITTGYFRATRAVDPRVLMEFNNRVTANRISPRQTAIPTMISGEVAHTADRIGEATALALAASLYAASEQIKGRTPRGVRDLLGGLAARNLLPPELSFTQAEGTLVSPYGHLSRS